MLENRESAFCGYNKLAVVSLGNYSALKSKDVSFDNMIPQRAAAAL